MAKSTTPRKRITRPKTSAPRVARKKALSDDAAAEIAPAPPPIAVDPDEIIIDAMPLEELPLPAPPYEIPAPAAIAAPPARPGRRRGRLLLSFMRRLRAAARRRGAPVVKRVVDRFPLLALLAAPLLRRLRIG